MEILLFIVLGVAWLGFTFKVLDPWVEGKLLSEGDSKEDNFQNGIGYGVAWCIVTSILISIVQATLLT